MSGKSDTSTPLKIKSDSTPALVGLVWISSKILALLLASNCSKSVFKDLGSNPVLASLGGPII